MSNTRPRLNLILLSLALVIAAGCGGGSHGVTGTPADSRDVLFSAIAAKFDAFDGTNPANENQQMLAYLKTRPEFVESGLSDAGGVWGRFADGSTMAIANNLDRNQPPVPALKKSARRQSLRTRDAGFPTSETVLIGTGFGLFYEQFNAQISDMFLEQPY